MFLFWTVNLGISFLDYVHESRHFNLTLCPVTLLHPQPFLHPLLQLNSFLFERIPHRSPLTPPYEGPFRVLHRGEKVFELDIGGRKETVSIDRLKPAFIDLLNPPVLPSRNRRGPPKKNCTA